MCSFSTAQEWSNSAGVRRKNKPSRIASTKEHGTQPTHPTPCSNRSSSRSWRDDTTMTVFRANFFLKILPHGQTLWVVHLLPLSSLQLSPHLREGRETKVPTTPFKTTPRTTKFYMGNNEKEDKTRGWCYSQSTHAHPQDKTGQDNP